jgi:hypothetical protein
MQGLSRQGIDVGTVAADHQGRDDSTSRGNRGVSKSFAPPDEPILGCPPARREYRDGSTGCPQIVGAGHRSCRARTSCSIPPNLYEAPPFTAGAQQSRLCAWGRRDVRAGVFGAFCDTITSFRNGLSCTRHGETAKSQPALIWINAAATKRSVGRDQTFSSISWVPNGSAAPYSSTYGSVPSSKESDTGQLKRPRSVADSGIEAAYPLSREEQTMGIAITLAQYLVELEPIPRQK